MRKSSPTRATPSAGTGPVLVTAPGVLTARGLLAPALSTTALALVMVPITSFVITVAVAPFAAPIAALIAVGGGGAHRKGPNERSQQEGRASFHRTDFKNAPDET